MNPSRSRQWLNERQWLEDQLSNAYADVAAAPVPAALLELLDRIGDGEA